MKRVLPYLLFVVALSLTHGAGARGLSPDDLKRVGYDQHIGQPISPGLTFQEADKRTVAFRDLFNSKPTLLVLGYYQCPMLCTLINDGMIEALQELRFNVGRDFNVINVSIDPHETSEMAANKKKEYLTRYGRPGAAKGWHFLTGDEQSIEQLANEAGFRYKYDPELHQYAHPSGFIVLTPDGTISRYFFGVNFEPAKLRTAIIAASNGQEGSIIHELVLLCCRYNPITGKYGALILTVLRGAGIATVLVLAWGIVVMCRRGPREVESTKGA
ncbi:MAG TPA: SCO family protein [Chthoniobacterales bacterium]|jgi:protein SCO1/2